MIQEIDLFLAFSKFEELEDMNQINLFRKHAKSDIRGKV